MSKSTWILVVVAGVAAALGYGVVSDYIDVPVAIFAVFLVLACVVSGVDRVEVVEIPASFATLGPRLPIGFHPDS